MFDPALYRRPPQLRRWHRAGPPAAATTPARPAPALPVPDRPTPAGPAPAGRAPGRPDRTPRGARRGLLARLCGPGAVVAVAYVDPGNFATNVAAGSTLGTRLLWVVAASSTVAVLVQYLSAKLGVVTGLSLPELCRERYRPWVTRLLWLQAEVVAMATDLAEVVGGAIALHLLLGVPLPVGGLLVAVAGVAVLGLRPGGRQRFQTTVALLLAVVVAAFAYQVLRVGVGPGAVLDGLRPSLGGSEGLLLATGIVGATVMPHMVYLHSALTADEGAGHRATAGGPVTGGTAAGSVRADGAGRLRRQRRDIVVALAVAGLANASILLVAARALHVPGAGGAVDGLEGAFAALHAGSGAVAVAFAVALLTAGLASSGVGTLAGDVIMAGFLRRRVPLLARRLATLLPALAVLVGGVDATSALVVSQVVLAVGLPFALGPLLHLTACRAVMGPHANRRTTTVVAAAAAVAMSGLSAAALAAALG